MIPPLLANQIKSSINEFLTTEFSSSTPYFQELIKEFLAKEDNLFKGYYLSIGLPFRPATNNASIFPQIPLSFTPHRHQEIAFRRLKAPNYQSTLVATGTGSGKTECYMIPILDYCYQNYQTRGIKAILIYPMNALATDQSKRLARLIDQNPQLKGKITAGLYLGESEKEPKTTMAEDHLITDKKLLRQCPPDILLTNYKMLDYLLIRPSNQTIWAKNDPETLRYLVVDEIHTFDGAQGTDLACLIRRLKGRLHIPNNHLVCVGTSATLGGETSQKDMLNYAQIIFNETFDESSIIVEDRLSASEFLADAFINYQTLPDRTRIAKLYNISDKEPKECLKKYYQLWFDEIITDDFNTLPWQIRLGDRLKSLPIFHNILKILDNQPIISLSVLWQELNKNSNLGQSYNEKDQQTILTSLLTLGAIARNPEGRPWVNIRIQLWLRELRRMVATVSAEPKLVHYDDLTPEQQKCTLPVLYCYSCGSMGWGGRRGQTGDRKIGCDIQDFYVGFFSHHPLITFIFPINSNSQVNIQKDYLHHQLCTRCLRLNKKDDLMCQHCGNQTLVSVIEPNIQQTTTKNNQTRREINHNCPFCDNKNGLVILGSRAASLASIAIGTLFTSPYNNDPKLICFSDSVQDAAHRAGFFETRTYRFTVRSAIYKFLENVTSQPDNNLETIRKAFPTYWRSQLSNSANYIATFIPSDMEWLKEWETLQKTGKSQSSLVELIDKRLDWEIVAELGLYTQKGGSLEKSYSCSISLRLTLLQNTISTLHEKLVNEIGSLVQLTHDDLTRFILGLIYYLRQQGGIFHPATTNYIESGGNPFRLQQPPFMPRFGPSSLIPNYLANTNSSQFTAVCKSTRGHSSWYENWVYKLFSHYSLEVIHQTEEIYNIILEHLVTNQILGVQFTNKNVKVWGIEQTALEVHIHSHSFQCNKCCHQIFSTPDALTYWENMPCLRTQCNGHYLIKQSNPQTSNFYHNLYKKGKLGRIFAREHTGLLKRDVREELEQQFTQGNKQTDPNLLSATSTLEMGIDIGDLSSVLLCSIPPNQANYQQRIGRAGRRDGNALITAIANGISHDLYFWSDPLKMLNGEVTAPGSYLDASAILQRQLTAYCLDRWVVEESQSIQVLEELGKVLNAIENKNLSRLPYPWLNYIDDHQQELLQGFINLFTHEIKSDTNQPILSESTINQLHLFIEKGQDNEGGLTWQILNRLQELVEERKKLKNQIDILRRRLKEKEQTAHSQNHAEEMEEMKRERSGLMQLISTINEKNLLNFLTDEGLLPNYAFPEAGVTLQSIIWRKKHNLADSQGNQYETTSFTYERPGAIAIKELVPNRIFYAEGKQVTIDQIDLNLSKIEEWRLCRNCSFTTEAIRDVAQQPSCPRCGDNMWPDDGRKQKLLRLKQVIATSAAKDSRIGDERDARDEKNSLFFNNQMLIDFEPNYCQDSYLIEDETFPFGFEFISKVTLREINFGSSSQQAINFEVAGENLPRAGFRICRYCGKVQTNNDKDKHTFSCRIRNKTENPTDFSDVIYLFREFQSEAIRFLLPVDTLNSDEHLQSFIAALQLGLKLYFHGNVDHLKAMVNTEPALKSNRLLRKPFLFLYDTIPGGTGYLRQLVRDKTNLCRLFQEALKVLKTCECEDGCYNCLYAYRNNFHNQTSRRVARNLLNNIVSRQSSLKLQAKSNLSNVTLNALFDSVLEQRFVEALRRYRHNDQPTIVRQEIINGKAGYFVQIGENSWNLEPQVELGINEGITVPSRADFVFYPTKQNQSRPIAIFTDGWQYHCNRLAIDFDQRMAISKSGKYYIWSLTWQDVESQFGKKRNSDYFINFLEINVNKTFSQNKNILYQKYQCPEALQLIDQNSFVWLMYFLINSEKQENSKNSESKLWTRFALVNTLAYIDSFINKDTEKQNSWYQDLETYINYPLRSKLEVVTDNIMVGTVNYPSEERLVEIYTVINKNKHQENNSQAVFTTIILHLNHNESEEKDQKLWNGVLRLFNLYQFLPYSYIAVSPEKLSSLIDTDIKKYSTSERKQVFPQWQQIENLVAEEILPLLPHFQENNWLLPEVGYELNNDLGTVIAEAELAWIDYQFAIILDLSEKETFLAHNWVAVTIQEFLEDPEYYRQKYLTAIN